MNLPLEHLSFLALFDALTDAMILVDQAGKVTLANAAACDLLGYAKDEVCGLQVEMLMPERFRDHHHHHHRRDAYTKKPEKRLLVNGNNFTALTRDGRELSVGIGLTPLKTLGQLETLVTFHVDRRHQAEESLRLSEERLYLAKTAAGFGVYDRDLISNALHWDDRSRELLGLTMEEDVTFEKFEACIHPEDRVATNSILNRALDPAGNGEYRNEFRIIRRNDGAERWIATVGRISFNNGQPMRLLGVMQDVTEFKVMDLKLQQLRDETDSLVKQQIAVQTASAIAHEINQPLTAISAYSEVALRSLKNSPVSAENLSRALEGCVEQAQRAGNTLHELLDFLQKGDHVVEPVDLNDLVRATLVIAKRDGYGGFNPILHLAPDVPAVLGNPIQIQKVLLNLLRNGVEAMRGVGMAVSNIRITVRTMAEKNMAQVTVQDSGPGFDKETAKRVFEPFFTTKLKGIGMGLAVSRTLIEINGGQLWLDLDEDSGATFHFTLPFAT